MAKQGLEFDHQYDWIIKKAGGQVAKSQASLPLAGGPTQRNPVIEREPLGNSNVMNRRGNTADALAKLTMEERKDNRMMLGGAAAKPPPARFQQAAAAVLGGTGYNKAAPIANDERRHTLVGASGAGQLPPTGAYRG